MNFIHFDKQTIGMRVTFARHRMRERERQWREAGAGGGALFVL